MASKIFPLTPWRRTELSTAPKPERSAHAVYEQAFDLFVLGFTKQANALLEALYDYGHSLKFDIDINSLQVILLPLGNR